MASKTSVYLGVEELRLLDELERFTGRSRSQLLRDGIRALADQLPEIVLAEVDHLLLTRGGVDVESAFLADVAAGAYSAECLTADELHLANQVVLRYRDLEVGLADASMVVLAARYGTSTLVTLEERCFRAMRPLGGGHFTLLPADL